MRSSAAARVTLSLAAALAALPRAVKGESAEPAWVTQPPPNTADSLYGVGEGPDLEDAKRNALKDAAGRLRVSLSSKTQRSVKDENGAVYSSALSEVLHEVQKTEFASGSGMRIAPTSDRPGTLVIAISTSSREQTIFHSKMVLLNVMLAVRNAQLTGLASRRYEVNGSSMSDYAAARASAVVQLGEALRRAGPVSGLGL